MWTVFKVFIEFVTILLLFYVLWDLSYRPWFEPAHPALEGEVLTTGPPGKSLTKLPNIWNQPTAPHCPQEKIWTPCNLTLKALQDLAPAPDGACLLLHCTLLPACTALSLFCALTGFLFLMLLTLLEIPFLPPLLGQFYSFFRPAFPGHLPWFSQTAQEPGPCITAHTYIYFMRGKNRSHSCLIHQTTKLWGQGWTAPSSRLSTGSQADTMVSLSKSFSRRTDPVSYQFLFIHLFSKLCARQMDK